MPNTSVGESYKSKINKIFLKLKKVELIINLLLLVKIMLGYLI